MMMMVMVMAMAMVVVINQFIYGIMHVLSFILLIKPYYIDDWRGNESGLFPNHNPYDHYNSDGRILS
jgi:hypothetical protein